MDSDKKYMSIAIDLAKKANGFTFPNPPVGCVIVEYDKYFKHGQIISVGNTQINGRPHAEELALSEINFKKKKNYACFTTLEPCNHISKFNSCTDKIINSPIKKVVFSIKDPDKRTNGKGSQRLKNANILVKSGILKKKAIKIYEGYFSRKIKHKPCVTLKMATSLDGKIADKNNLIRWITNQSARNYSHVLRFQSDAIMIGKNTALIDNPSLDCRIKGLEKFSPKVIILSKSLRIPNYLKLFKKRKKEDVIIFTACEEEKRINLIKKKSTVIRLDNLKFNLNNILKTLSNMNISNLLVEGGSKINNFFLTNEKVDRLMIFRGNFFIGGNGVNSVFGSSEDLKFKKNLFKLKRIEKFDENHLEIYENSRFENFIKNILETY